MRVWLSAGNFSLKKRLRRFARISKCENNAEAKNNNLVVKLGRLSCYLIECQSCHAVREAFCGHLEVSVSPEFLNASRGRPKKTFSLKKTKLHQHLFSMCCTHSTLHMRNLVPFGCAACVRETLRMRNELPLSRKWPQQMLCAFCHSASAAAAMLLSRERPPLPTTEPPTRTICTGTKKKGASLSYRRHKGNCNRCHVPAAVHDRWDTRRGRNCLWNALHSPNDGNLEFSKQN